MAIIDLQFENYKCIWMSKIHSRVTCLNSCIIWKIVNLRYIQIYVSSSICLGLNRAS